MSHPNTMQFPFQLPDPSHTDSFDLEQQSNDALCAPIQIQTYPNLFPDALGGPFHPEEGVQLTMPDMLGLQLMYASRQVLTALCKEMGHPSLAEEPLGFCVGGLPGLYGELSLLSMMLSNIMMHALVFQHSDTSALRVWERFKACMQTYAPWARLPDTAAWKQEIARLQTALEDLNDLHTEYTRAKTRFVVLSCITQRPGA
jgi:hypothetical protein